MPSLAPSLTPSAPAIPSPAMKPLRRPCPQSKYLTASVIFPALFLALVVPVSSATIAWSSVTYVNSGQDKTIMGTDQIDQSGFKFLAVNLGSAGAQTLVQSFDPDIDFAASDPGFAILGGGAPENDMSLSSPAGTFHTDLGGNNNISGSAAHSNFLEGETGPVTFRLSNLVAGRTYVIQNLLFNDKNFSTDVAFDGIAVGGFSETVEGGHDGLLGIGVFTADAGTQDFTIFVNDPLNNPQGGLLNAIYVQSRTIPEPSVALLVGIALVCTCLHRRRTPSGMPLS